MLSTPQRFSWGMCLVKADPMLLVGWDVPLKPLHHRHVLRGWVLCLVSHLVYGGQRSAISVERASIYVRDGMSWPMQAVEIAG